ncbi:RHS repeat domain-containing protein [Cruoricaptor ignavus]|nr:RHS repeat-associated core domain-containing protein [Cruoricaptor ignavus]
MATYGGNFAADGEGKFTKYYSEDGSYEIIRNNQTGQEKHLIYIGGSPYESNIVYLKNFQEAQAKFVFLHKDYLGSILAISDEAGNKIEQRHFDAWGNLTHLQVNGGAIMTDENQIRDFLSNGGLLLDRGYTSHEHFAEVGLIHMNGRLYDPLLRRFLNADENIQDMFNTQNYNKYGYVLNNPLMYADPSGEFIWFIVGAIIGAYITGASANGTLNPFKWDWKATWGKIALGAVFGAISGGVGAMAGSSAAVFAASSWGIQGGVLGGAIAGLVGGAVGGAISGLGNAVIFGESIGRSIVRGFISGAIGGAIIGGAVGGIQQGIANAKVTTTGVGTRGNIWTGKEIAVGRSAWALNNAPKTTTVGKIPKVEMGMPSEEVIMGNGDGNLKLRDLGDGVKVTPKPNEIIQNVDEFNITGKGNLNGNINISQSDYNNLFTGYTQNSTPIYRPNGDIVYPFKINNYSGSFYTSTSGGIPSMQIYNETTKYLFKIRFTIKP